MRSPSRIARVVATTTVLVTLAAALVAVTHHEAGAQVAAGSTERVSVSTDGVQANTLSTGQAISADGRYVAFASGANNLVPGDTNGRIDVFVRDRDEGTTERVSVASDGTQGNDHSDEPSISADGRYVAFASAASNLVAADTNFQLDVFVHDRHAGTTERVSLTAGGGQILGAAAYGPVVSAAGTHVVFQSQATNVVPGKTTPTLSAYVRDLEAGTTEWISVPHPGAESQVTTGEGPVISADGRFVAYYSSTANHVEGDTNNRTDVFVRDRETATTQRVSVGGDGTQGDGISLLPSISADGRYVAFESDATTLIAGGSGPGREVFVHDRLAGTTSIASLNRDGVPANGLSASISADGRSVAYESSASDLVAGSTASRRNVFVRDRVAGTNVLVSVPLDGNIAAGGGLQPEISANGMVVAFGSFESNLVPDDTNGVLDVFVRDATTPRALELVGLEVNQGIQDWRGTVALVRDRDTVVRAFVQTLPEDPAGDVVARAELVGTRGGVALPGSPLAAHNVGNEVAVGSDVLDRRAQLGASFNFVLPPSWRAGTVELEFRMTVDADGEPLATACAELAPPVAGDCSTTVMFEPGPAARVRVVGVGYTTPDGTFLPTPNDLRETGHRLRSVLPVSSLHVTLLEQLATSFDSDDPPDLGEVNAALLAQRALDGCLATTVDFPAGGDADGCQRLYYGHLSGDGGGLATGVPGHVSSGYDRDVTARNAAGYWRNVAPHEVGHSAGLEHSVRGPADENGEKHGVCGEVAGEDAPDFPYFGEVAGLEWSLLNPPDAGVHEQMWGLDARFARGDVNLLAVVPPVGPRATFDLMGYCWIAAPQDLWPSDYSWNLLRGGLERRFTATSGATPLSVGTTSSGRHLVFTGSIDLDTNSASLDSPLVVDATDVPTPPAGDHLLRLTGLDGGVVAEVPFEPIVDSGRPTSPGGEDEHDPSATIFVAVPLPDLPVARVAVVHGGGEIGSLDTTPNAPTTQTLAPAAGSVQDADTVRFAWSSADADGDEVDHHVRYSPDGGETWTTLAVRYRGTEIEVPRRQLAGSTTALFEVQAVDGLNVTTVASEPFTVLGNAPEVIIERPVDEDAPYVDGQLVILEATAEDPEDGDVSDTITWASNRDGSLDAPDGFVAVSDLSEGTHVLTASATDGDGVVGSATVTIVIGEADEPPESETVTYTARYDERRCRGITNFAAGMGLTPAEMIRLGVNGFRGIAESNPGTTAADHYDLSGGVPDYTSEGGVACEFEVVWEAEEAAALEAAAAWWGVSGDRLHSGGGWLVVVLIYRAIMGLD